MNKLTESRISAITRQVLKEFVDYEGADLAFDSVRENAIDTIIKMEKNGIKHYSWRAIAEEMGYRIDSFNEIDLETLKEAIEAAMVEMFNPQFEVDRNPDSTTDRLRYQSR